jgi:hypothetical protein
LLSASAAGVVIASVAATIAAIPFRFFITSPYIMHTLIVWIKPDSGAGCTGFFAKLRGFDRIAGLIAPDMSLLDGVMATDAQMCAMAQKAHSAVENVRAIYPECNRRRLTPISL